MKREPASSVPLARLLAMAYRQLIDRLHERLAAEGYTDVRPTFGYVLLAVRDGPTTTETITFTMANPRPMVMSRTTGAQVDRGSGI